MSVGIEVRVGVWVGRNLSHSIITVLLNAAAIIVPRKPIAATVIAMIAALLLGWFGVSTFDIAHPPESEF